MEKRTKKKSSYPDFTDWNRYQSLYRDPVYTKLLLLQLERQYKKLLKNWSDFWDMVTDMDPQYCFICGYYVLPKMRNDKDRIKKPYKNGDVVHSYCFTKESTVERMTGKLNPDSELICKSDMGWSMIGKVCRVRVKNNDKAIKKHIQEFHTEHVKVDTDFEYMRAIYFLKPNGKPFPVRRDWQ